jgi:hypothetical protein
LDEQLKLLIELQKIDSSIISIAERIESLPRKLDEFRAPVKKASDSFQKAKLKYEALNKKKKDKDLQLDEIQDKIDKLKSRTSEIKTNKEYEAHLKEIKKFENDKYQVEEEILALMEEIEAFAKDLKNEEIKFKKAEEDFKRQEKLLEEEKKELHLEMESQKAKRKDFVAHIDEENYSQYMNLLKRMGGLAVVETKNEVCLGCNTNIPPQLYNDIKKNDALYTCFYCKRFLYYKEPDSSDRQTQKDVPAS